MLLGKTFLRDLPMLKSLKIANVDFELNGSDEPQWLEHLERLHLENASFGQLPRWIAKCKRLEVWQKLKRNMNVIINRE